MSLPTVRLRRILATTLAVAFVASSMTSIPALAQDGENASIEGPQWQLVEFRDEGGRLTDVPPGIGITMILFADTYFGDGACSTYDEGRYTLARDTLQLFEPVVAARTCDEAARRIDDAFYDALLRTAAFTIDGASLRLRDAEGGPLLAFTLARVPSDPTIAPWRLGRISDADGASGPVIEGSTSSFRFLPGGSVIGTTGCGSFLGRWATNDTRMTISDVDFRLADCTTDLRDQAELILATLGEITDFTIRPAGLSLEDEGRVARLALVPDIPLAERNWSPIVAFNEDGSQRLGPAKLQTSSIRFAGDRVSGRTPCRDFSGANDRSGLAVTVFDLAAEKARCPKKAPERAYLRALERVASHALRGAELELLDKDGAPVMRLVVQPGLRDVPWVVASLDTAPGQGKPRLRPPNPDLGPLTADFFEGELLTGDTGRTTFNAFYFESGGAGIDVSDAQPSIPGCGRRRQNLPVCQQERLYLQLLRDSDGYEIRTADGQLVLLRGSRPTIVFEPAEGASFASLTRP